MDRPGPPTGDSGGRGPTSRPGSRWRRGFPGPSVRGQRGPRAFPRAPAPRWRARSARPRAARSARSPPGCPRGRATWRGEGVPQEGDGRRDAQRPGGAVGGAGVVAGELVPPGFQPSAVIGWAAAGWSDRSETSQTRAVPSSLAETTERPSGVKATALTPPDAPRNGVARGPWRGPRPDGRVVVDRLLPLPEASNRPSGEKARPRSALLMPFERRDLSPGGQLPDRRMADRSSDHGVDALRPPRARNRPSGERATRSKWIGSDDPPHLLPEAMSQIRTPSFSAVMICFPSGEKKMGRSSRSRYSADLDLGA